jgi:hypothetical protein
MNNLIGSVNYLNGERPYLEPFELNHMINITKFKI